MKQLSSKIVYKTPWISIISDELMHNQIRTTYTYVRRSNGVFVALVNKSNQLCLLKQYRYPIRRYSWEIPGGSIDKGETISAAAIREVEEETGIKISETRLLPLIKLSLTPGLVTNYEYVFVCKSVKESSKALGLENELIEEIKFFSLEESVSMIDSGEIVDATTIASIYKLIIESKLNCV